MIAASPALVLLPGLDGTGRLFERLVARLEARLPARVVSYPADATLGYPELIDFVCAEIGPSPVLLLGESFSGPVAIEAAARMAGRVKGLILAATFARSPLSPWLIRMVARVNHQRIPEFFVQAALMSGAQDPELAVTIADLMKTLPHELIKSRLGAVAGVDATPALASLSCPILALHGAQDWIVPKTSLARALANKTRSQMKILKGPHMLLQANAGDAADEIEAFARGAAPKSAPGVRPWVALAMKWRAGEKALTCPDCGGRIDVLGVPWPDGLRQDTYFTCKACGRYEVATGADIER